MGTSDIHQGMRQPTNDCYAALSQSLCKSLVFTCTKCRRKGTLARRLLHAELTLENSKVQKGLYEQLLEDKQQQVVLLMEERDVLKFEKERLESQLDEMRYELRAVKLENTATATTNTPVNTTVVDNMASGRCKLPQLPVTTAPVHDLKSESCHSAQHGVQHLGGRSGDDLLPSVSTVTSEI